jgi:hypothetical protein
MICKLTGKEGTPAKAHVIPRSFYFLEENSKRPLKMATNKPGVYPKRLWEGIYDETTVTMEGEKIFLKWDDYAYKLLVEQFPNSEPIENKGDILAYKYEAYDYPMLKLFFLSVLWRAGASSHPFFKRVNLGRHLEILRTAILASSPGDPEFYSTSLAFFIDDPTWAKMMDPFPERHAGIRFYRFYLGNIVAYIKVDKQGARDPLKQIQLRPQSPLFLISRKFWKSKEAIVMKRIAEAAFG